MAFEATTEVRATRRWLLAALIVYVGVGFFALMHSSTFDEWSLLWGLLFLVGECAFGFAHAWLPKRSRGRMVADETGLYVDGKRIASRASIRSAHGFERRGVRWLRLMRLWGQVDVAVDGEDEHALMLALRLDPHGIVTRYVLTASRRKSRAVRAKWTAMLRRSRYPFPSTTCSCAQSRSRASACSSACSSSFGSGRTEFACGA